MIKRNNPKLFLIYLFLILNILFQNSFAKEPKEFIQEVTSNASNILMTNVDKGAKILELRSLAEENVDINGVGLYSLGKHRKILTVKEMEEYKKLFKEYFLKSFSSRLSEYTDPRINVLSQKKLNENYTIVSSILIASGERPEVKIDWRVYTKNKNKPLIRDLIIEGLSLARTQKEEFNSVIQSADGDINKLFKNLKDFVNN